MLDVGRAGTDVHVLDYVRTGRGRAAAKGGLADVPPVDLVVQLQQALAKRNELDTSRVQDVVLGLATQVGEQGADLARTSTLLAGWDTRVPGGTVNRFCASGIDAVAQVAARVGVGELDLAVAGGVESVSRVPMFSDGGPIWTDPATISAVGSVHMGISADLNATIDGWRREQLDAYAVETQAKAASAWESGAFDRCVVPIQRPDGTAFATDELIRPQTTLESLAALPPAFGELGAAGQDALALAAHPRVGEVRHLHTIGTSPQLADAGALLLLGSSEGARRAGLRPRGRIVASATVAGDPVLMLTAGQQAIEQLLTRTGLAASDIDAFEFAEAFSAMCLRLRRDLQVGPERLNPTGGTIAMGHAFGATGAIMVGGVVEELERRDGQWGIAAVSGAAGLGVAVLVERVR